jgi:hypothetical protein
MTNAFNSIKQGLIEAVAHAKTKDNKDRVGPSLKFKQAMLDKFLKMIEETALKMKSKSALNFVKRRRET